MNFPQTYFKKEKMLAHSLTEVLLKDYDVDPETLDAIRMHNECSSGKERQTEFQHALAAGETITGMIFATT